MLDWVLVQSVSGNLSYNNAVSLMLGLKQIRI